MLVLRPLQIGIILITETKVFIIDAEHGRFVIGVEYRPAAADLNGALELSAAYLLLNGDLNRTIDAFF